MLVFEFRSNYHCLIYFHGEKQRSEFLRELLLSTSNLFKVRECIYYKISDSPVLTAHYRPHLGDFPASQ